MHSTESHHPSVKTYVAVFAILMLLLAITVGVAEVHLGRWGFLAAVVIATVKAALIMLIFMHVKYSPILTRLFAIAGFFWLTILFTLTLSDYFSR